MKCADCRFFERNKIYEWDWLGQCRIQLPAFVGIADDPSRTVRHDEGCDLGQPVQAPQEDTV